MAKTAKEVLLLLLFIITAFLLSKFFLKAPFSSRRSSLQETLPH
jgi:hypothetical protein